MAAVEIVRDKGTKEHFAPSEEIGPRVQEEADKRGLFSRTRGDIFVLAPPAVTTEAEIDRIVEVLGESVRAVVGH